MGKSYSLVKSSLIVILLLSSCEWTHKVSGPVYRYSEKESREREMFISSYRYETDIKDFERYFIVNEAFSEFSYLAKDTIPISYYKVDSSYKQFVVFVNCLKKTKTIDFANLCFHNTFFLYETHRGHSIIPDTIKSKVVLRQDAEYEYPREWGCDSVLLSSGDTILGNIMFIKEKKDGK